MNMFSSKRLSISSVVIMLITVFFLVYQRRLSIIASSTLTASLYRKRVETVSEFTVDERWNTSTGIANQTIHMQPTNKLTEYVLTPTADDRWNKWSEIVTKTSHMRATKKLPDVIGIGVKKCGTGAMIRFLAQHPLVESPTIAETMFFSSSAYKRGLGYYKSLMPVAYSNQLIAEKSPAYFHSPRVVERIKANLPRAKIILSLCNPVDRAFSDFAQSFRVSSKNASNMADIFHQQAIEFLNIFTKPNRNFDEIANIAEKACKKKYQHCYFSKGIYYPYVLKWLENFNQSQLLILNGEKWTRNPGELLGREQQFLNLPELITAEDFVRLPRNGFFCLNRWWDEQYHKPLKKTGETEMDLGGGRKLFCLGKGKGKTRNGVQSMLAKTRTILQKFYSPYNLRLDEVLDHNFEW